MSATPPPSRRQVLLGGAAVAAAGAAPSAWPFASRRAASRGPEGRRLLVIQLSGGNDGLSTVVPYADDTYRRLRPTLRLGREQVLDLDGEVGLHRALTGLRGEFDEGRAAIIESAGYPDPFLSHFRSLEMWHTGRREGRTTGDGWLGRLRAAAWGDDPREEVALHVGPAMPYSMSSSVRPPFALASPRTLAWFGASLEHSALAAGGAPTEAQAPLLEAGMERVLAGIRERTESARAAAERVARALAGWIPRASWPKADPFSDELRAAAGVLLRSSSTRIVSVTLGNFDHHGAHALAWQHRLLTRLDRSLSALREELRGTSVENELLVLIYSDFGRRVAENLSQGTDHGSGAPMFLLGPRVRGGFHGVRPDLTELDELGNVIPRVDFRGVYSTLIADWFGQDPARILGRDWPTLELLS